MLTPASNIALIGFGAAARHVAAQLAPRGCAIRVFDPPRARHIAAAGADAAADLASALRGARLVLDDRDARQAIAGDAALRAALQPGQILVSMHGDAAQELCGALDAMDAAQTLLLSGPRAPELADALASLGLRARATSIEALRQARAHDIDAAMDAMEPAVIPRGELP